MNEGTKPKVKSYWAVFVLLERNGAYGRPSQAFTWYPIGTRRSKEEEVVKYAKDRTLNEYAVPADNPTIRYASAVKITKKEYLRNSAKPTITEC